MPPWGGQSPGRLEPFPSTAHFPGSLFYSRVLYVATALPLCDSASSTMVIPPLGLSHDTCVLRRPVRGCELRCLGTEEEGNCT